CAVISAFAVAACTPGPADPAGAGAGTVRVTRALGTTLTFDVSTRELEGLATGIQMVVAADVDNKNGPDLVFLAGGGDIGVPLNGGAGSFNGAPVVTAAAGCLAVGRIEALAVEQLSADTNPDVLIGCQLNGTLERRRGAGDGTFGAPDLFTFNPF